jgi:Transport protein Trs120 or TRAPPC9, TRAPP II complex subunit
MSAEDFFYCAPGRLKVLVVPLGKVRTSLFSGVLQFFHENTTVPFKGLDVERCENAMFNPATFPQGQLMFECLTSWDPSYAYLEDLQPWRKLYAVYYLEFFSN